MTLDEIIAITGKPGLYKILTQNKGNIIVESLTDKKRFPVMALQNVSTLKDISIYTYEAETPLRQVFLNIYTKENGIIPIDLKDKGAVLAQYFRGILPEYDEERVYTSNIKKVFSWYNALVTSDFDFKSLEESDEESDTAAADEN
ncbi:MAG: DUF5606 domain-containing protein [Flavobacteriales bacterium]|jgi:hypothetical protein|nr:DUF5606 domain-containing protein [Flavobacteriales bacterium]